jgi:hypothetical protein
MYTLLLLTASIILLAFYSQERFLSSVDASITAESPRLYLPLVARTPLISFTYAGVTRARSGIEFVGGTVTNNSSDQILDVVFEITFRTHDGTPIFTMLGRPLLSALLPGQTSPFAGALPRADLSSLPPPTLVARDIYPITNATYYPLVIEQLQWSECSSPYGASAESVIRNPHPIAIRLTDIVLWKSSNGFSVWQEYTRTDEPVILEPYEHYTFQTPRIGVCEFPVNEPARPSPDVQIVAQGIHEP